MSLRQPCEGGIIIPILQMNKQGLGKQGHKDMVKAGAPADLPQLTAPHSGPKPHLHAAWSSGFQAEGSLNPARKPVSRSCCGLMTQLLII